jgi:hypothetical protein
MWVNLLASQIIDHSSQPRFVNILAQLGPAEAWLLASLQPRPKDDPRLDFFIGGSNAQFGLKFYWISALDQSSQPWNLSVTLICQQSLAEISPLAAKSTKSEPVLLHLTPFGEAFLGAVAPQMH